MDDLVRQQKIINEKIRIERRKEVQEAEKRRKEILKTQVERDVNVFIENVEFDVDYEHIGPSTKRYRIYRKKSLDKNKLNETVLCMRNHWCADLLCEALNTYNKKLVKQLIKNKSDFYDQYVVGDEYAIEEITICDNIPTLKDKLTELHKTGKIKSYDSWSDD